MNLARLLVRSGAVHADRPALVLGKRVVSTYAGFAQRASALAGSLTSALALKPGERVAVFATNDPGYLEILYGAWIAGLVVVPINSRLHPKEVAFIVEDSGAAAPLSSRMNATSFGCSLLLIGTIARPAIHAPYRISR